MLLMRSKRIISHNMFTYPQLLDLSYEILLMVFKELTMVDVLHSVSDVNQRFRRIAHDFLYIRQLDLTGLFPIKFQCHNSFATAEQAVSRICEKILRRIHDQVHQMTLECYSMKDILVISNYPRLYSLSLRNIQNEFLHECLKSMFVDFV